MLHGKGFSGVNVTLPGWCPFKGMNETWACEMHSSSGQDTGQKWKHKNRVKCSVFNCYRYFFPLDQSCFVVFYLTLIPRQQNWYWKALNSHNFKECPYEERMLSTTRKNVTEGISLALRSLVCLLSRLVCLGCCYTSAEGREHNFLNVIFIWWIKQDLLMKH